MIKKILFVNASLSSGGSEKVMTILANEFCKNGYECTMILVKDNGNYSYHLDSDINCIKLEYKSKNKIMRRFERIRELRRIIKKEKYDCVVSFMYDINTDVLLSCLDLKVPVIVSERCDPASRRSSFIVRKIENFSYRRANAVVLQTEQVKAQYPKYLRKKFIVIPNPISDKIPKPYEGIRKKKIVAVGRLTNQKNFKLLIDAYATIVKKYNDYTLYIYGEGPLKDELHKQVSELHLNNSVVFPGFVKNVDEEINDAELYISTSNYEGISNSMLEALAMGIPSICTDCPVGGASLMIKNHINGILVPVGDRNALIQSICELIENRNIAKKISEEAIKTREEYSSSNIFKKWEKAVCSESLNIDC